MPRTAVLSEPPSEAIPFKDYVIRVSTAADAEIIVDMTVRSVAALAASHYPAEVIANWMGDRTAATYREATAGGQMRIADLNGTPVGHVSRSTGRNKAPVRAA